MMRHVAHWLIRSFIKEFRKKAYYFTHITVKLALCVCVRPSTFVNAGNLDFVFRKNADNYIEYNVWITLRSVKLDHSSGMQKKILFNHFLLIYYNPK